MCCGRNGKRKDSAPAGIRRALLPPCTKDIGRYVTHCIATRPQTSYCSSRTKWFPSDPCLPSALCAFCDGVTSIISKISTRAINRLSSLNYDCNLRRRIVVSRTQNENEFIFENIRTKPNTLLFYSM